MQGPGFKLQPLPKKKTLANHKWQNQVGHAS